MSARPDLTHDACEQFSQLLQLERDSLRAYDDAVEQLNGAALSLVFTAFAHHHARHIAELDLVARSLGIAPSAPHPRSQVSMSPITLRSFVSARSTIRAIKSREDATSAAYRALAALPGVPDRVVAQLQCHLGDERRHRTWIEVALENVAADSRPVRGFGACFAPSR